MSSIDHKCVSAYVQAYEEQEQEDGYAFTINITLSNDSYMIRRSLAAFYDLDATLRRKFPKSDMLTFPLEGSSGMEPVSPNKKSNSGRRQSLKKRNSMESTEQLDTIQGKLPLFTEYINKLLDIPEILKSNVLWCFLDYEYADGNAASHGGNSVVDMIFADAKYSDKTVVKSFEVPVIVKSSDYIAWSFSTKHKDIGFSVQLNGTDIVAYQRYNSHEESVSGVIEVPQDGVVLFLWDNSYSRFRSKSLSYATTVLSAADMSQFTSTIRQGDMYIKYRSSLRRCLLQQAAEKLSQSNPTAGVVGEEALMHGMSLEEIRFFRLEKEIERLISEKSQLEQECIESADTVTNQEGEIAELKAVVATLKAEKSLLDEEAHVLRQRLEDQENSAMKTLLDLKSSQETYNELIERHEAETLELKEKLERLSTEIQLKDDERLQAVESIRHDMEKVQERADAAEFALREEQQKRMNYEEKSESLQLLVDSGKEANAELTDKVNALSSERLELKKLCTHMQGVILDTKREVEVSEVQAQRKEHRDRAVEEMVTSGMENVHAQMTTQLKALSALMEEYKSIQQQNKESSEAASSESAATTSNLHKSVASMEIDVANVLKMLNE